MNKKMEINKTNNLNVLFQKYKYFQIKNRNKLVSISDIESSYYRKCNY